MRIVVKRGEQTVALNTHALPPIGGFIETSELDGSTRQYAVERVVVPATSNSLIAAPLVIVTDIE